MLPAGAQQEVVVPFHEPAVKPAGSEYFLMLELPLAADQSWADAGHVLAWEQFHVPFSVPSLPPVNPSSMPAISAVENSQSITIAGQAFGLVISKTTGVIESFTCGGTTLIDSPLVPNCWRAPTDNDRGNGMPARCAIWKHAGSNRTVQSVSMQIISPQELRVTSNMTLDANGSSFNCLYTIYGDATVRVQVDFHPGSNLPELPRLGMQTQIPAGMTMMEWFGRGPFETMTDRKFGNAVGRYAGRIEQLVHDYVRPQENGNRTDVRWVSFTDTYGNGLMIRGEQHLSVSAWPYTMETLENAKHITDLLTDDAYTVNIDYGQTGVGGANSWGAQPLPQYILYPQHYSYAYTMTPTMAGIHPPINVQANTAGPGEIHLSWTDTSDNEDGFIIQRKPYQNQDEWHEVGSVGTDETYFIDTHHLHGEVNYGSSGSCVGRT